MTVADRSVLVTRAVPDGVIAHLRASGLQVHTNQADEIWPADELIRRLQGHWGALITIGETIDDALLAACPTLRAICTLAVGINNIDLEACRRRSVVVTHAPDVLTETTADLGFALMLAAARRVGEGERLVRSGGWTRWSVDFHTGQDVHGTTLGILGMGRIGQAIARRGALGFGMTVLYHNRMPLPAEVADPLGAQWCSTLDELLARCDHLMIVLPYSPAAHHLIDAQALGLMKPTATLTNIARGGIVDELALVEALQAGRLAAAALDVFENEPKLDARLLEIPNLVLTPHIGSATRATRQAMARLAADNLIALANGWAPLTPVAPVRPEPDAVR
jgi:gluconate 2-dehydrogenase